MFKSNDIRYYIHPKTIIDLTDLHISETNTYGDNEVCFESILLKKRIKQISLNIDMVMEDIMKQPLPKYLDRKIDYENRMKGYPKQEILSKIQSDRMYASFFILDPMKQNLGENLQLELMKMHHPNIHKLPPSGKNARYISTLGVVSNSKGTKSFDFYNKDTNTFYICKYTHEEGGAQDNQCIEVKQYIEYINHCTDDTIRFVLLLDGDYWKKKWNDLENLIQNKNCILQCSTIN